MIKIDKKTERKIKLYCNNEQAKKKLIASKFLGMAQNLDLDRPKKISPHDLKVTSYDDLRTMLVVYPRKKLASFKKTVRRYKALKKSGVMFSKNPVDFNIYYKMTFKKEVKKTDFQKKLESFNLRYKVNKITRPEQLDSTKNYIGLELEFFCNNSWSRDEIIAFLEQAKVKCVSITSDGSIRPDSEDVETGHEIKILLVNDKKYIETELKKLCSVLNKIGATVNKSCGLHVHIDARNKDSREKTKMIKRLSNSINVLSKLVPKSRRNNQYCQPGVSKRSGSRYYAVNLLSLKKYNTIEVRLHSGTVDYLKIKNWIELLNIIVSTKNGSQLNTLDEMVDKLSIPDSLALFYYGRYKKFNTIPNSDNTDETTDDSESSINHINQAELSA